MGVSRMGCIELAILIILVLKNLVTPPKMRRFGYIDLAIL
jgi:hypothetical protein